MAESDCVHVRGRSPSKIRVVPALFLLVCLVCFLALR